MSLLKKIAKYLWPQMRNQKWTFLAVIFLLTARVVIDFIVIPVYFKDIINLISAPGVNPALVSRELFILVFIIIVFHFLVSITARTRQFLYFEFLVETIQNLRNYAFQKLEKNSQTFFANTFAGSLVTKVRRFVNGFERMLDIAIFNFLFTIIVLIGVFVVMIQESLQLTLILFGVTFVYMAIIFLLIKKKIKFDLLDAAQDSVISGRLADVFSNISAVKFFSAREKEISSFKLYTDEGARRSRAALYYAGKIEIVQSIFSFVIQAILLYVLVYLWVRGEISTGSLVMIQGYVVLILIKLWDLSNALTSFMKSAGDMNELIDIFELKHDIVDPIDPEKLKMKEGKIVFDKISFKYQLGGEVLSSFNLDIQPGERVGIVGHSGAGKSTITRLLLRLNDVTKGSITIDGQDIINVTQDDLRSAISYVPQEPILFHRSIKENIAYGKPEASMEEIVEVAKKAHADEFISKLLHGYDTLVGERGVKLSGGERQRVAIARAMLKDSPILMLDEATSSLDSVSESYIQDAFNELMKDKTTIVIAHRLSTIQKMDRIIVLDKGEIVEEGTHKELLAKNGFYAELWNHQTGGFLE